ncbi:MAG: class I SAM-dependent methyltransferase [Chloroflexota bacterium]|nr:class I SAM-dependent methyltransferase [Chloroflexota bacterium]
MDGGTDERALVPETRAIWEAKAAFWDERMGEGNAFQRELVGPASERLLGAVAGETVLDVACGNGVSARRLAALGARVVATDFSQAFLDAARARGGEHAARIDYRLVDATDEAALLALGEGRFTAVVCAMALMDMPTIAPLTRAVARLLAPGGRFVFAVQHPAFNSNGVRLGVEDGGPEDRAGTVRYVRVTDYLRLPPGKGVGMPGEPEPHWYFHRPLAELFGVCFAAGLVLDGLEEPAFAPARGGGGVSWLDYTEIPPVLAARWRVGRSG